MRPPTTRPTAVAVASRQSRSGRSAVLVAAFAVVLTLVWFARPAAADIAGPARSTPVPSAVSGQPSGPGTGLGVGAGTELAQASEGDTTPLTRVPLESTPVTESGAERNSAGLWVLIGILAVIGGGAVVLFLRYRNRPRTNAPAR